MRRARTASYHALADRQHSFFSIADGICAESTKSGRPHFSSMIAAGLTVAEDRGFEEERVNPYVAFGLVMCGITILALIGTAYMAVFFNRRAKADLEEAFGPLSQVIHGTADVEEAVVSGKYGGHIAEGRIAVLPGGMGRVFHVSVVDGAGGVPWTWTVSRSKEPGGPDSFDLEGGNEELRTALLPAIQKMAVDRTLVEAWFKVDYQPESGLVRLARPMKTRRDLPTAESFTGYLDDLVVVAASNRAVQYRES
jgi:hypothetical protein